MQKVEYRKIEKSRMKLRVGAITFIKMFLRGVLDLSFIIDLYGDMNQVSQGKRIGIELPNGDRIVAVKISANEALIISALNRHRGEENIMNRVEQLISNVFKLSLAEKSLPPLNARAISSVGKKVSYV